MLRACRRLLRPGGHIAFTTIVVAKGLSKVEHLRAARLGPRAVSTTRPLGVLMKAAGFQGIEVTDVTKDFIETAQSWFDAFAARECELRPLFCDQFDDRQRGRLDMIVGTGEGLLRRLLVSATAPPVKSRKGGRHGG